MSIVVSLLNGISFGAVLFLLAAGLSLILGLMGIFNLAHGALYMLGAYVGWTIAVKLGLSFWLAALVGGLAAGLVGVLMERGFLSRLYKKYNEQVLLTLGFVYIAENTVRWIWGSALRPPFTAELLAGPLFIGEFSYPASRLVTILIALILAVVLWLVHEKTRAGVIVRAGMDNEEMTMGLGINLRRVSSIVFGLAAFIAGFAGVIGAQIIGVSPDYGMNILLLALIVLVVGGIGSIQGALLGAMIIGIVLAFGPVYFPLLDMFAMYLTMVIILALKPSGLMGRGIA